MCVCACVRCKMTWADPCCPTTVCCARVCRDLHPKCVVLWSTPGQEVDFARAQHYAESIGAICIETSAKTNVHVHDAFVEIGESRGGGGVALTPAGWPCDSSVSACMPRCSPSMSACMSCCRLSPLLCPPMPAVRRLPEGEEEGDGVDPGVDLSRKKKEGGGCAC